MKKNIKILKNRLSDIKGKTDQAIKSLPVKIRPFFLLSVLLLITSVFLMLFEINKAISEEIPKTNSHLKEGILGTPRFVNPILASSNADKDLSSLIFSGLMKKDKNGEVKTNLARNYNVLDNNSTYTFELKDDLKFHDGKKLTSKDVEFTINSIQNSLVRSPLRSVWDDIEMIVENERKIEFHLDQPDKDFLEKATVGILPKHIWADIDPEDYGFADQNIEPVGSGPFELQRTRDGSSQNTKIYELNAFSNFALGKPYLGKITIYFYSDEDEMIKDLKRGRLNNISAISPKKASQLKEEGYTINRSSFSRMFALFFNKNNPSFETSDTIKAIEKTINKDKIVENVLMSFGQTIDGPIHPSHSAYNSRENTAIDKEEVIEILKEDGWSLSDNKWTQEKEEETIELDFSISTSDTDELRHTAELIKKELEKININVSLEFFESNTLNEDVIRPRDFDVLLFGKAVNQQPDLFSFWHSSQRNDPGLNISSYTSTEIDELIEELPETEKKEEVYKQIQEKIRNDRPAIFLYSPEFLYIFSREISNFKSPSIISEPNERFNNIHKWFLEKENIWPIFNN